MLDHLITMDALPLLRKQNPEIINGDVIPLFESHATEFAYERKDNEKHFVLLKNFTAVALPEHITDRSVECLIINLEPTTQLGSELTLALITFIDIERYFLHYHIPLNKL